MESRMLIERLVGKVLELDLKEETSSYFRQIH